MMDRVSWLRQKAEGYILDIGSADGHTFAGTGKNVVNLDLDAYPIPNMIRGEAERLPFRDHSFDTVVLAETIEHITNPYPVLRELKRVCRKKILITTPDESRWSPQHRPHEHYEEGQKSGKEHDEKVKEAVRNAVMVTDERARPHLYHRREYDVRGFRRVLEPIFGPVRVEPLSYDGWYFLVVEIEIVVEGIFREQVWRMLRSDGALAAKELIKARRGESPNEPGLDLLASEVEEWVRHVSSKEEYAKFYTSHRGVFSTLADVRSAHSRIPRLGKIREWMEKRAPKPEKILDLGCFDGFALLNVVEALRAEGVGVDLDPMALERAEKLASEMGVRCRFARGFAEEVALKEEFDAVLVMELLEHVIDPEPVIRNVSRHLSREGRLYITIPASPVPHFENVHESREHVRCLSREDLERLLSGYKVESHELRPADSHIERMIEARRKRCSIVVNEVAGGWSPLQPGTLGGSEEAVVGLAKAMVGNGFAVEIFHNPSVPTEEVGGVKYAPLDRFDPSSERDTLLLFKCPQWLDAQGLKGDVILWTADPNGPSDLKADRLKKVSFIVAISEWHRQELLSLNHRLDPSKVVAAPLGVDEGILRVEVGGARNPHRVVYASSFDRGLEFLLDSWTKVRSEVPDAELHIWYGWDIFDRIAAGNPKAAAWKEQMCRKMAKDGVVFHGRAESPSDPAIFRDAALWAYPCTGGERFCLTAVKAQKLGAVPVVVPEMALSETVRYGKKVPREWFARTLVEALKDEKWQTEERARMVSDPEVALSWDDVYAKYWRSIHSRWVGL